MLKKLDLFQETLKVLKKWWFRKCNLTAVCSRDQRAAETGDLFASYTNPGKA